MQIRQASPEDAETLTRIAHDAQLRGGYPVDWITRTHSENSISAAFITGNEVYVADESGELQGFYVLAGDRLEIEQLWVATTHFGTGVGKELFLHAKERIVRKRSGL
jgi:hypothetical protein